MKKMINFAETSVGISEKRDFGIARQRYNEQCGRHILFIDKQG